MSEHRATDISLGSEPARGGGGDRGRGLAGPLGQGRERGEDLPRLHGGHGPPLLPPRSAQAVSALPFPPGGSGPTPARKMRTLARIVARPTAAHAVPRDPPCHGAGGRSVSSHAAQPAHRPEPWIPQEETTFGPGAFAQRPRLLRNGPGMNTPLAFGQCRLVPPFIPARMQGDSLTDTSRKSVRYRDRKPERCFLPTERVTPTSAEGNGAARVQSLDLGQKAAPFDNGKTKLRIPRAGGGRA